MATATVVLSDNPPYPAGPERLPPIPRPVALNPRARRLRAAALLALLILPNVFLFWGRTAGEPLRALVNGGQMTRGRVTRKSTTHQSRGGTTYRVAYVFEAGGREYHAEPVVTQAEYSALSLDAPCDVCYLPGHPDTNCPGNPETQLRRHNTTAVAVALVFGVMCAVWLGWVQFAIGKEWRLAREGEPAVGWVADRGTTRTKNGMTYWVSHQFVSPADETPSGRHNVPYAVWQQLTPGMRVTLLYDPANARRHLPLYAFRYARIVDEPLEDAPAA